MSRMAAFATALALAVLALPRSGSAADAVVLQLAGPATFEVAGYYAALWQGFYRAAGLDVTIRPGATRGQAPADPVREVIEGRAQFGTGTAQLVVRRAQGLPLLLLAPIFQQSGAAVYYRADSDFSSPAALVNARLGRLAASDILDIELASALRAEGIDPARTKSVTLTADQIVPALVDHTIDAAVGSAWIVPWQAHEHGTVFKSFNPANYRVEYYGDSLFTLKDLAATQPRMVARFRAATLKGWEYALHHPDDMIARLVADKPDEPPVADIAGFDRYQADVAHRLARFPEIPLGYSNAERWSQIEASIASAGGVERNADMTGFVYRPAPEAPPLDSGGPVRDIVPIAAAAAGVAALAALFWSASKYRVRLPRFMRVKRTAPAAPEAEERIEPLALPIAAARRPRAVAPPAPLPPPPLTNLNDVLAPLERRIRQRVRGKVRCRFSLFAGLWPCRTEGGPVAACVLELVGAATAVMDANGTLTIGTRNFTFDAENIADYPGGRLGRFARITVRDSGPGLTDAQLERIFDAETSVRPAVANAAAVTQRLDGFVRVESAEGVGTAVHLYFARIADAEEMPEPPAAEVAE